jgi:hypothetical protein
MRFNWKWNKDVLEELNIYFVGVNEEIYDSERNVNRLDSDELSNLCNSLQRSRI